MTSRSERDWLLPIDPASEAEYQRNVAGSRRFAADLRQYIEEYDRRRAADSVGTEAHRMVRGGDEINSRTALPQSPHPSQRGEAC